jgi:hypothetical protein
VPGVNPVRLLTKIPVPVLSEVLKLLTVGIVVVAQQIPLAVTDAPPSEVMLPPETAVVWVIDVIEAVVSTGNPTATVVNVISLP